MAATVYILCFATSLLCALLLGRAYLRSHVRLLLWSCLCFVFLSLNNAVLFIDLVMVPQKSLIVLRSATALIGLLLLVFGLIWDS